MAQGSGTRRYTASVVGGGSGGKLSLAGLAASSRYELVGLADLRADVREELAAKYPDLRTYATHQEMFAAAPTEVVCVSTWPPSHREIVVDSLGLAPKGILCEKPLGDTAAAGADILAAIKAAGLPVVVPHGLMQNRHAQEIIARVRGGEIGELELVEIESNRWDIINAGIHWLNFFVNLVPDDSMDWVMAIAEASTQTYRDGMEVETNAITYVQTKKGVRTVMHSGDDIVIRRPDKGFIFRLVGTRGQIEFYAWESRYWLLNAAHPTGQLYEVPRYAESAHQRYLDDLAEQMDTGRRDYAIPESSLVALELVEGAYLSSAHRCRVTLPLSEFTPPPEPDWRPGKPYRGQGGRDGRKLSRGRG